MDTFPMFGGSEQRSKQLHEGGPQNHRKHQEEEGVGARAREFKHGFTGNLGLLGSGKLRGGPSCCPSILLCVLLFLTCVVLGEVVAMV